MSGLHDYIVERDHFKYTNTLGFFFPCCVCAHRNIRQQRHRATDATTTRMLLLLMRRKGESDMKLKPCPFCEEEADIHVVDVTRSSDLRFKYEYQPGCETDKCPGEWGGSSYCSADEAYEQWNTRATDPLLKEMTEALAEIVRCLSHGLQDCRASITAKAMLQKYHERESPQ